MITVGISIRAEQVVNHGDGVYTVHVETQELPPEVQKMIRETFPHTSDKVYELLSAESLLANIQHDYTPNPSAPISPETVRPAKIKKDVY